MSDEEVFKPHILIVGAGLGGLALAAILEKSGISYEVFERASAIRHLGSAISVRPSVMPLFDQLGVLDKVYAVSKVLGPNTTWIGNDKTRLIGKLNFGCDEKE
jgi:2-polyprenyl-6-methoxyphenol hydroxylase-like FAD-dependent oxidoreductase